MESCKFRLEAVLQSTGIPSKGAPEVSPSSTHSEHASALVKLQATEQQEARRMKATQNSLNQKEAAVDRKMAALKAAESEAYQSPNCAKKRLQLRVSSL